MARLVSFFPRCEYPVPLVEKKKDSFSYYIAFAFLLMII